MDGVPRPLADFGPDVLADADDVAGRLHPHKLPIVAQGLTELAKKAIPDSRMKIYVPPIM